MLAEGGGDGYRTDLGLDAIGQAQQVPGLARQRLSAPAIRQAILSQAILRGCDECTQSSCAILGRPRPRPKIRECVEHAAVMLLEIVSSRSLDRYSRTSKRS
jgi:hypothetical protein